jgi:hypothetical protein
LAELLPELGFQLITFGSPYDSLDTMQPGERRSWWRDLAQQVLGERVVQVAAEGDVDDLTPLAELKRLRVLLLDCPKVSNLEPLVQLKNLQKFSVRDAQVSDLAPLAALNNLQHLKLSRTQVSDLTPLARLAQLKLLELRTKKVSDVRPLAQLTALNGWPSEARKSKTSSRLLG